MRLIAIVIALFFVATSAEARIRPVVKQDPPLANSLRMFGAGLQDQQEPQKVIPARMPAPRVIARHGRPHWRVAAVYRPHWRRIPIIDPPPRHRHVVVEAKVEAKPLAFFAVSKVSAHALGVTDHSLLFGPTVQTKSNHLSAAAPWAGALVF